MGFVTVYARIYADCLKKALQGLAKNAWTLLLPGALMVTFGLLIMLLSSLLPAIIVGFVVGFVMAGLISCYLYFVGEVVGNSRVRVQDFRTSLRAYLWSVVNVMFVLWIAGFVGTVVVSSLPNGGVLWTALTLAAVVAFNAAPEVIYQRGTYGGLATFHRSLTFLQENWIEWGIPNLLLFTFCWQLRRWSLIPLSLSSTTLGAQAASILTEVLFGAFVHVLMVFRGHLFAALDGTTHRQRMFKFRNATGGS